jgi:hypothetical protein
LGGEEPDEEDAENERRRQQCAQTKLCQFQREVHWLCESVQM